MNAFTEDYYLRGRETGLSNYTDYKWMPDATISWAHHLRRSLGIKEGARVLDVGAARGFYVKALRLLGVDAYGHDVSEWAVSHCDPDVSPFMSNHLNGAKYDLIYSKDCFEHIPPKDLTFLVKHLLSCADRLFVIVPLAKDTGGEYVHEKEEKDATHVNRWTLPDWLKFFESCSPSFVVNGSYRYPGLKPGSYEVECGYGFFTLNRI
jgi:hypothetical protein